MKGTIPGTLAAMTEIVLLWVTPRSERLHHPRRLSPVRCTQQGLAQQRIGGHDSCCAVKSDSRDVLVSSWDDALCEASRAAAT